MDNFFTYSDKNIGKIITNSLISANIPIHTFSMFYKDKVIFEHAFEGHEINELHEMYSISKTITAISVLYLHSLGILSIDDLICKYFTDLNTAHHALTEKMTIKDMLMMRTVHSQSAYTSDNPGNWSKFFFDKEPDHLSGTEFSYDTSASQVLAAMVERLTGLCPLDFIKNKLPAIGFSDICYSKPSPDGYHMGGTGLEATHIDIRNLGIFILESRRCSCKDFQIKYLNELSDDQANTFYQLLHTATSNLTDTAPKAKDHFDKFGYGYFIWHNEKDGIMLYGLGGQFVLIYPEKELIVVTTGDTNKIKGCNDQIFSIIYENLKL